MVTTVEPDAPADPPPPPVAEKPEPVTSYPTPPPELVEFDRTLRELRPGEYRPNDAFFKCVRKNYADLDLVAEAIKFESDAKDKQGQPWPATNGKLLKWLSLQRRYEQRQPPSYQNGAAAPRTKKAQDYLRELLMPPPGTIQ